MATLTGNKDTDMLVLLQLNDYDLSQVCQVNKKVKKICQDDMFWKKRLLSITEILKLSKEYLAVDINEETFIGYIKYIKEYLEFSLWKDFYIFLRDINKKYISWVLRESIVRFIQEGGTEKLTLKKLSEISPGWVNVDELLKELRREFFIGYGRGDGQQGMLRLDKIESQANKFLNMLNKE